MTINIWEKTHQGDKTVLTSGIGHHRKDPLKELSRASHFTATKAHDCKHFKCNSKLLVEERIHTIKY